MYNYCTGWKRKVVGKGNNVVLGIYVVPTKLDEETSLCSLAPCKMVFEITLSPPDESNAPEAS
jgi:hypothetical protein